MCDSDADSFPAGVANGKEFELERYKHILKQIDTVNGNVYRFLAIYQGLSVSLASGGVLLAVGYRNWHISASVAKTGIVGVMWLLTVVASFSCLLIIVGVLNWFDYRREECELTDISVHVGFRKSPRALNFFRWYETYILLFIVVTTVFLWVYTIGFVLPSMK